MSEPEQKPEVVQLEFDDLTEREEQESTPEVEAEDTGAAEIQKPFNPSEIRMDVKTVTVDLLVKRLREKEIDMAPPFQRQAGLWDDKAQSRLIESLLIRIPIPAFYFDARDDDRWVVVDGLQRLTVLRRFLIDEDLELTGLQFLTDYNNKRARVLPRSMRRRIEETQVIAYLIQPGTPEDVKFNIFQRINTGGMPLTAQEIRHALNQGPASELLKCLADSSEFKAVTRGQVSAERMADRECVLRFMAFVREPPAKYQATNLDSFLHRHMRALNKESQVALSVLGDRFLEAMRRSNQLLGRFAFRKVREERRRGPVNKALFEAWSVNLEALSPLEIAILAQRKPLLLDEFVKELNRRDFERAVTQGTGDPARVRLRFEGIANVIQRTLAS